MEVKVVSKEYIDCLEWFIDIQYVFLVVLYRDLNRVMESPLFMRKINKDGIDEVFKMYAHAKEELETLKKLYEKNAWCIT